MKERPILFSGAMIRAIVAGQKTQTRRAVKPAKHPDLGNLYDPGALALEPQNVIDRACPYGQPGDRLWVRETWQAFFADEMPVDRPRGPRHTMGQPARPDRKSFVYYRADGEVAHDQYGKANWIPSIHMPRRYSRILLEVISVRVERLQDISVADAIAEGVESCRDELATNGCWYSEDELYSMLWTKINGHGSWNSNPWVWVVEFGRVEE